MKHSTLTLFTGSLLLASALFTGCGGEVRAYDTDTSKSIQPHQITSRTTEEVADSEVIDYADMWENYVSISSTYNRTNQDIPTFSIDILCQKGISSDVAHFQVFLDTDNNANTGLTIGEGDYAITGADYMIEDGLLFKSTSNSDWGWTYVDTFAYQTKEEADDSYSIKLFSDSKQISAIIDPDTVNNLNLSMEPIDSEWSDTNNYVSTQHIPLEVIGEKPSPVLPSTETVYEDAENGIGNWITIKGDEVASRKTPGYKNQSLAFVHLPHHWTQDANGDWHNSAEYNLPLNDTTHTILSVDIVGDGTQLEHYDLGVKVTTQQGERYLLWDSFYNHENLPASNRTYDNGRTYMVFPSPVELVRGYDFSDPYLAENFTVDLEAALKHFEPGNEIISVDTFVATGGNLDNIKLMSK